MKVKYELPTELDWREIDGAFVAETPFGPIVVAESAFSGMWSVNGVGSHVSVGNACESAFELYQGRLASALTPSPDAGGMREYPCCEGVRRVERIPGDASTLLGGVCFIHGFTVHRSALASQPAAEGDVDGKYVLVIENAVDDVFATALLWGNSDPRTEATCVSDADFRNAVRERLRSILASLKEGG